MGFKKGTKMKKKIDMINFVINKIYKSNILISSLIICFLIVFISNVVKLGIYILFNEKIEYILFLYSFILSVVLTFILVLIFNSIIKKLNYAVQKTKRIQKKLEFKNFLLRTILNTSPDLIYFRDEQSKFLGCNYEMELLTGKKEKDLKGLSPIDVYDKDIADEVLKTDREVLITNRELIYEQWLTYADGHKECVEFRKLPLFNRNGLRVGLVGYGRKITERKNYLLQKKRFISSISHEIKTPLNGILGCVQMLKKLTLDKEQSRLLKVIDGSASSIDCLFQDLINIEYSNSLEVKLKPIPTNIHELIIESVDLIKEFNHNKQTNITLSGMDKIPSKVVVDEVRFKQIILNLLENAVKYSDNGKVNIFISLRKTYKKEINIQFEIRDEGFGISEKDISKIFDMYYRSKNHLTNSKEGKGIGLSVCKEIIELMGGNISVSSEEGRGSIFKFNIIVDKVDDSSFEGLASFHKVLLVEDVELNVEVMANAMMEKGHKVFICTNKKEFDEITNIDSFDFFLIDNQLPDILGEDLAILIEEKLCKTVPLICLTADVGLNKLNSKKLIFHEVLYKPLNPRLLDQTFSFFSKLEKNIHNRQKGLLNYELIESYVSIVPKEKFVQSINLFKTTIIRYIDTLNHEFEKSNTDAIISIGHKMKSACGSIGLSQLENYARKIELEQKEDDFLKLKELLTYNLFALSIFLDRL